MLHENGLEQQKGTTAGMKYRKCTCGADIREDKIYCEKCGRAVQIVPDYDPYEDFILGQEETDPEDTESGSQPEGQKSWRKYAAAGACLVVFGCLAYQYAYHSTIQADQVPVDSEEVAEGPEELLEKPQFGMEPGTYSYSPMLTLSHNGNDGQIYYTADGTTPDEKSRRYEAPILLGEGTTVIRAVFIRTDGVVSEEAVGTYQITFTYPDEPVFSVPSGEYTGGFSVTMTSGEGCRIYYTTNGEEPGPRSRLYQGAVYIPPGLTVLQAVAIDEEGGTSGIVEAIYNVSENPEPPVEDTGEIPSEVPAVP